MRYLLESVDVWALTELCDLSKGAFSQLPAWLQVGLPGTHQPCPAVQAMSMILCSLLKLLASAPRCSGSPLVAGSSET